MNHCLPVLACCFWAITGSVFGQVAEEFEEAPIFYSKTEPTDPVAQWKTKLERGETSLAATDETAFLRLVLAHFGVPVASQILVFSKTSLQRDRIHPARPRAIFFSEDYYIGWVQGGNVEIISVDSALGPVFYLLEVPRAAEAKPVITRSQECLSCHATGATGQVPGLVVRSVHADSGGFPLLAAGSKITDHASPLAERWGGWYVTGRHSGPRHLGNLFYAEDAAGKASVERDLGGQPASLASFFNTIPYPAAESDIVALMMLEHQCAMHNLLTAAAFATRQALYRNAALASFLGDSPDKQSETTRRIIAGQVEKVLRHLLFVGETVLDGVEGSETFQTAFRANARKSREGRSLKDFQLHRRLFKHRCSYMIYSRAFAHLPAEFQEPFYRRLWQVLAGEDTSGEFSHLSASERARIRDILRDTKEDLPAYWRA